MDMDKFKSLARRARAEQAPTPDVVAAVMRRLRTSEAQPAAGPGFTLWVLSSASACAAIVCALLGYVAWTALSDPWQDVAQSLSDWWVI